MKAWKLIAPKTLEFFTSTSAPVDSPAVVKVKIEMAAMSHTDFIRYNSPNGDYPFIPGRHAAGFISEVYDSPDSFFVKSDRVVIDPVLPCGECVACKTGHPNQCNFKKILGVNTNGLYTDFITLPVDAVHRIPQAIPFETAVFTEYVAMAVNTMDKIDIKKGDHVAILGSNKIGYVTAQIISYYQGIPVIIDNNEEALEEARSVGISYALNTDKTDVIEEVFSLTGGRLCEKVIYLTNTSKEVDTALDLCAYGGVPCLDGYVPPKSFADFEETFNKQLTINTVNSGYGCFPAAINLLANKTVSVNGSMSEKDPFDKLDTIFANTKEEDLIRKSKLIII